MVGSSSAGKALESLAYRKLRMSQQHPGSRERQQPPGLYEQKQTESVRISQELKASSGSGQQECKSVSRDQNNLGEGYQGQKPPRDGWAGP